MSHLFFYVFLYWILFAVPAVSQKKWTGFGGDDHWSNPLNWSDNVLPDATDEIILDNSFAEDDYIVWLPDQAVTVKSVLIDPASGKNIELLLPSTNLQVPGLVITGKDYGLTINNGGIFRNASGIQSGVSVTIRDSIRINNGGRYVHGTAGAHAANVQVLSATAGTEKGVMEFDVPDASTTLSLSGRVYGSLVLSSATAGGSLNYTAAGTNRVLVRSDLQIKPGVKFNLNFSDTFFIGGDLLQDGGVFNLGNTSRTLVLDVHGNIFQSSEGIITETGTGNPSLLLSGDHTQHLDVRGSVLNEVSVVKKGSGDVQLDHRFSVPYKLVLHQGKIISSQENMLNLLAGCTMEADTIAEVSFIQGPVHKEGLTGEPFLFPVGTGQKMRWIALNNATGNFKVEYFSADPYTLSAITGAGLHHVSHIEYWNIFSEMPAAAGSVQLSFADPNSGGVSSLEDLRVAELSEGIWTDAGNAASGGTPGGKGWVSSYAASGFSAGNNFLALASAIGQENPLPISEVLLKITQQEEKIVFNWQVTADHTVKEFELQESSGNNRYSIVCSIWADSLHAKYQYILKVLPGGIRYYRVLARDMDGRTFVYSKTISIKTREKTNDVIAAAMKGEVLELSVFSGNEEGLECTIYSIQGVPVKKCRFNLIRGRNSFSIPLYGLPSGIYVVLDRKKNIAVRFIK